MLNHTDAMTAASQQRSLANGRTGRAGLVVAGNHVAPVFG
tara:strand:- start:2046 stop:2165 length:120 start_codon:yes stop_codon:yes gene_type:complete